VGVHKLRIQTQHERFAACLLAAMLLVPLAACASRRTGPAFPGSPASLDLPAPRTSGPLSLEESLLKRRSVRAFSDEPLTLEQVGQLLWAAQGVTDAGRGFRTAPSAGALYPLVVYVVLPEGCYSYDPQPHTLTLVARGDKRAVLKQAALGQEAVGQAPAVFVVAAVYERTARKYGQERSPRYVHLEAGHAAQNLLLQAVALDLGAVPVGAFDDAGVRTALSLPADHQPLYLIPAGHSR